MTELQKRIATAIVLIPLVLYLIFFLENQHFKWAMAVVLVLGSWEWCRLIGIKEVPGQAVYISIALLLAFISQLIPSSIVYLLATIWWIFAIYLVVTYPSSDKLWQNNLLLKSVIGFSILVPTWLGVVELQADSQIKMMFIFVLVWAADIGAYFAGRKFGKHKLAPRVSPGKSIEGVVGGLLLSLILGLAIKNYVGLENLNLLNATLIFSLVILFSVLGDLSESLFKRASGVKDSSQLLPGHGGILDRIDSLTSAVPIYYASIFLFA
jgi:phosphatidate cytidylyltransferase